MQKLNLSLNPEYPIGEPVWQETIHLTQRQAPVNASYSLAPAMRHTFTRGKIVASELREKGWYYACQFEGSDGVEWMHQDSVPVRKHQIMPELLL